MKKALLIFIITSGLIFSTSAKSFYNSSTTPMIKMMTLMMELMSQMMVGGGNNSFPMSSSALLPMSTMAMGGLPMSPMSGLGSGFGGSQFPLLGAQGLATQGLGTQGLNGLNPQMYGQNLLSQYPNQKLFNQTNVSQTPFSSITSSNSLNGIWQALSGDIMAIYKDNRFIWTDGKSRHLAGTLMIKDQQFSAYITANKKIINFQFYRENNKFAVKDASGNMHIFTKIY